MRNNARDCAVLRQNIDDLRLLERKIFLLFEDVLHNFLIFASVRLNTQRVDRRAFAEV